jgi:cytochrome d ubiquinol oxidase subunit I
MRGDKVPKLTGFWTCLMVFMPLWPIVANTAGWFVAELGRQPWIVMGVLPLRTAVSPTVTLGEIAVTMTLFTLIYAVVAVLVVRLFMSQIRAGLPELPPETTEEADAPLSFAY